MAKLPFLPIYSWVGLWTSGMLITLSLVGASNLIKYATQFTDDVFNALLAVNFIYEVSPFPRRGACAETQPGLPSRSSHSVLRSYLCTEFFCPLCGVLQFFSATFPETHSAKRTPSEWTDDTACPPHRAVGVNASGIGSSRPTSSQHLLVDLHCSRTRYRLATGSMFMNNIHTFVRALAYRLALASDRHTSTLTSGLPSTACNAVVARLSHPRARKASRSLLRNFSPSFAGYSQAGALMSLDVAVATYVGCKSTSGARESIFTTPAVGVTRRCDT